MISPTNPLLFGDLHKYVGADSILVFIGPANQRLGFHDVAGGEIDDRLIDDGESVGANGADQLLLHALVTAVEHGEEQARKRSEEATQRMNTSE